MENEVIEIVKEIFGDVVASGICKGVAPAVKFCKPYLAAAVVKVNRPVAYGVNRVALPTGNLLSDLKAVAMNPFGFLWLLLGLATIAVAIWGVVIAPTETPVLVQTVVGALWFLYLGYFAWRGGKSIFVRAKVCIFD